MKASKGKSINKGSFGGSLPGKKKKVGAGRTETGLRKYKKIKASVFLSGTVGSKLSFRLLKRTAL